MGGREEGRGRVREPEDQVPVGWGRRTRPFEEEDESVWIG